MNGGSVKTGLVLHRCAFADLTAAQLYALIKLRVDTFVVEQRAAYHELDGLDAAPGTIHLWHELSGDIASVARMLPMVDAGGITVGRIGRIATAPSARGRGLAGELVQAAIDHFAPLPVVLAAQAHLEPFYARFGFQRAGETFDEHGIPHVPMRRG